jgi:hypothetical protein
MYYIRKKVSLLPKDYAIYASLKQKTTKNDVKYANGAPVTFIICEIGNLMESFLRWDFLFRAHILLTENTILLALQVLFAPN